MHVPVCSVEWTGSTCPGDLSSQDVSGLVAAVQPFDWSVVDPEELMFLFSVGFGAVMVLWFTAFSVRMVLDVIRKS